MTTFSELQDAVLFRSFPEAYRSLVGGYLNDAVDEVCRRLELLPTQAVVAHDSSGIADITDVRLLRVDRVYVAEGPASTDPQDVRRQSRYEIPALGPREAGLDLGGRRVTSDGQGRAYRAVPAVDSAGLYARIEIYPVESSGFIAVLGAARPARMSDDADESGLGAEVDNALIAYARARAFELEDDMEMGLTWQQEFDRRLRTISMQRIPHTGPVVTAGDDLYI